MDKQNYHIHVGSLGETKADKIEDLLSESVHTVTISQKFLQLTSDLAFHQPDLLFLAANQSTVPTHTIIKIIQTFCKKFPTIVMVSSSLPQTIVDQLSYTQGIIGLIFAPTSERDLAPQVDRIIQGYRLSSKLELEGNTIEKEKDFDSTSKNLGNLSSVPQLARTQQQSDPNLNFQGIYSVIQSEIEKIESQLKERLQPAYQNFDESEPALSFQIDVPKALSSINISLNRINYFSTRIILHTLIGRSKEEDEMINSQIMMDRILQKFAYQIDQHKVHISIKPLPVLKSNRASLERLFTILMTHALHSPLKEGRPFVQIWAEETQVATRFHIKHNGENLIDSDEISIFDKPEALSILKNTDTQIDFGLSMARAIVTNLGGTWEINSSKEYGTTISFGLYKEVKKPIMASDHKRTFTQSHLTTAK